MAFQELRHLRAGWRIPFVSALIFGGNKIRAKLPGIDNIHEYCQPVICVHRVGKKY